MPTPDAEETLQALQHYFLLHYREEARRRHPQLWDLYPLSVGSRLDVVAVNGGRRAHFFFSRTTSGTHVAFIHGVTLEGATGDRAAERQFLARQFDGPETLLHFIVEAPFEERFQEVEDVARRSVAQHAQLVKPAP